MKKLAIVGAGAAGVFCAAALKKSQNLDVRIYEASGKPLQKLLLTGGGRCNFTNLNVDKNIPREFYPRGASAIRKSLLRFGARAAIEFFEKLGVKGKVESGGRVFPASDKAEDVAEALTAAALRNGAVFELGSRVKSISKVGDKFELACGRFNGDDFSSSADAVMVCVGGNWNGSLRKSLEAFGHSFESAAPSLFSMKLDASETSDWRDLSGISVPCAKLSACLANGKFSAEGALLLTHFGIGGPSVLKLSSFGARAFAAENYAFELSINFAPNLRADMDAAFAVARLDSPKKSVLNIPMFNIPKALWAYLCGVSGIEENCTMANFPLSKQKVLIGNIVNFKAKVSGKSSHKEEFVTCGGLKLDQIDFSTMQSRLVPNLYFAGECLDIDGITGGFNLQAAWTGAKVAAENIEKTLIF